MSSTITRSLRPAYSTVNRSLIGIRAFSTSPWYSKGPIDVTKETLKKVDRTVSNAAVKGIEKGEKATEAIKRTVGSKSDRAAREAEEVAGQARQKTGEMASEAKEKAGDMASQAK
ncbi:hypothetical protein VTN49DRAFT_5332 [Thermomyces lanuginosus]|uniref:uncharacterized protein n=1 Tax=Thermomyces lanuginosus TaxID=5541 RepID=UPI0037426A51